MANADEIGAILKAHSNEFAARIKDAVDESRDVMFSDSLDIWERAGSNVAKSVGIGRVRPAALTLAGAYANMGTVPYATALQFSAFTAGEDLARIMRLGLLEGAGADELARRIRGYATGSEPWKGSFELAKTGTGEVFKLDLRKLPASERLGARKMVQNARRIAFSEVHNARAEAEVMTFLRDPLVRYVRWELSPDRGASFSPPDECDVLATADYFGLGAGIYPADAVPAPPHPYDRCERVPVLRGVKQALEPKPSPRSTGRGP